MKQFASKFLDNVVEWIPYLALVGCVCLAFFLASRSGGLTRLVEMAAFDRIP